MNDLFDRYEIEHFPKVAATTRLDYQGHLKSLRKVFGRCKPHEIKPRDIGQYLNVETGKQRRNKCVALLSNVFTYAVTRWYIEGCESNPCLKVARNKSQPRTRYITNKEFKVVRASAPKVIRLAMDLAYYSGQRQGDLLNLKWEHIVKGHILFQQSKTKKKMRIRIGKKLKKTLKRARNYGPPDREHVLCLPSGAAFSHGGFRVKWQRVIRRAFECGLIVERFTFHDIRAKCASDSKDLHRASVLLGHASIAMTRRVYDRGVRTVDSLA